jgi:hypothetical protein
MNGCRRMRALLFRSVEGYLEPSDALRLARHLDRCTRCRIVLARERRLAAVLDDLNDPIDVDESFFESVMASLPDRPAVVTGTDALRRRWRRGLRLAGIMVPIVWAGVAASRLLPALRFDVAAPAMPRFTPASADGWLGLLGSAAQWVRITADSMAWSGGSLGASVAGVLAVELTSIAVLTLAAGSAAWALAARARSRTS